MVVDVHVERHDGRASFSSGFCPSERVFEKQYAGDVMSDSSRIHVVVAGGAGALGEAVVDAFVA